MPSGVREQLCLWAGERHLTDQTLKNKKSSFHLSINWLIYQFSVKVNVLGLDKKPMEEHFCHRGKHASANNYDILPHIMRWKDVRKSNLW